ncbi:MAG: tyrosine--tRNA ligase [Pseudohongiellaceae bacterium]
MTTPTHILDDLDSRGLISRMAGEGELKKHLNSDPRTLYCGFDPTADSLHIGSLMPLLALKRFQLAGHRPIVLVGGATGLIGDPSFKTTERELNSAKIVAERVEQLKPQLSRFLDFEDKDNAALLVNNLDWTQDYNVLTFLRDVGKHFSVNAMVRKESVRQRIEREGEGISFTEFSYMILQAYDFAELYKRYNCTMQIGGSDQWGNITAGIDLTRRLHQTQVYGLTLPLMTKTDGSKFGKTEAGTVWLDPEKTSCYAFYQFWLNTTDEVVYHCLRYFTFRTPDEIAAVEEADKAAAGRPEAQTMLARDVTELVHGKEGMQAVERISKALFSGDVSNLTESDFKQMEDGMTAMLVQTGINNIVDLLVASLLASSRKRAREFISNGAVQVNGEKVTDPETMFGKQQAKFGRYLLLKRGKKQFKLLII